MKIKFAILVDNLKLTRSKLLFYRRRIAAFQLILSNNIGNSMKSIYVKRDKSKGQFLCLLIALVYEKTSRDRGSGFVVE